MIVFVVCFLLLALGITSMVLNANILPVFIEQTGATGDTGGTAFIKGVLPIEQGGLNSAITNLAGNRMIFSSNGSWGEGTSITTPTFVQPNLTDSFNQIKIKGVSSDTLLSFEIPFLPNQKVLIPEIPKDCNFIVSKSDTQTINGPFVLGNGSILFREGKITVPNTTIPAHKVIVPLTSSTNKDSSFVLTESEYEQKINGSKDLTEGIVSIQSFVDNPYFPIPIKVSRFLPDTTFLGTTTFQEIKAQSFESKEIKSTNIEVSFQCTGGALFSNDGKMSVYGSLDVKGDFKSSTLKAFSLLQSRSNTIISGPTTVNVDARILNDLTCGSVSCTTLFATGGTNTINPGNIGVGTNMNLSGTVQGSNVSGFNSGDITIGAFGSTPNSGGASIGSVSQVLNLQPASASFGGAMTTTAQTIPSNKLFKSRMIISDSTSSTSRFTGALLVTGAGGIACAGQVQGKNLICDEDSTIDQNLTVNSAAFPVANGVTFFNNLSGSNPQLFTAYDVYESTVQFQFNGAPPFSPPGKATANVKFVLMGRRITFTCSSWLPGGCIVTAAPFEVGLGAPLGIPAKFLPPQETLCTIQVVSNNVRIPGLLKISFADQGFGNRLTIYPGPVGTSWLGNTCGFDPFSITYYIDVLP